MKKTQNTPLVIVAVIVLGLLVGGFFLSRTPPEEKTVKEDETTHEEVGDTGSRSSPVNATSSEKRNTGTFKRQRQKYIFEVKYPAGDTPGAEVVEKTIRTNALNFAERAEEENIGESRGPYEKITKYEMFRDENKYSYVVETYEYTNGATGLNVVTTFVFNETGRRLTLEDVVGETSQEKDDFLRAVKDQLRERAESLGIFPDAVSELTFEDLRNFYITDEGIFIAFSQYRIAPGAAGIIRVNSMYKVEG